MMLCAGLLLVVCAQTSFGGEAATGENFLDDAQKYMSFFHDCYQRARRGEGRAAAMTANGIVSPESYKDLDDRAADEQIMRRWLCGYGFDAVESALPDSTESVATLYRREAVCAALDANARNLRTMLDSFNEEYGRYPKSLTELRISLRGGVEVTYAVAKKGETYRATARAPGCDKEYVVDPSGVTAGKATSR